VIYTCYIAILVIVPSWTARLSASAGPRGRPLPRIFMFLGGMKVQFLRFPGACCVCGASIVQMSLSCLVDLNSDFYRLRGSLHGLDSFWARGLSWMNKDTHTHTHTHTHTGISFSHLIRWMKGWTCHWIPWERNKRHPGFETRGPIFGPFFSWSATKCLSHSFFVPASPYQLL